MAVNFIVSPGVLKKFLKEFLEKDVNFTFKLNTIKFTIKLKKDSACAIFYLVAYFIFNVVYWVYWHIVLGRDFCHNQLDLSKEGLFKCIA